MAKRPRDRSSSVTTDEHQPPSDPDLLERSAKRLRPNAALDLEPHSMEVISDVQSFELRDWNALQELFATAVELNEGPNPRSSLPLLRRVLRECERFLAHHKEPHRLFAQTTTTTPPPRPDSPQSLTPPEVRLSRDWDKQPTSSRRVDSPAAFHSLYGRALFLFGTQIMQDPSTAFSHETIDGMYYLNRALDVFEVGENLLNSRPLDPGAIDDFHLALYAGRTLSSIAADRISRPPSTPHTPLSDVWPRDSPFSPITTPLLPRRLSLARMGASDILYLAVDQLTRAFLHMPRVQTSPASHPSATDPGFSRCRVLHTVGCELLDVAHHLQSSADRRYWAIWTDGNVFGQMALEPQAHEWAAPLALARGRCLLLAASAGAELLRLPVRRALHPDPSMPTEQECREDLQQAIQYLSQAHLASDTQNDLGREAHAFLLEATALRTELPASPDHDDAVMDVS